MTVLVVICERSLCHGKGECGESVNGPPCLIPSNESKAGGVVFIGASGQDPLDRISSWAMNDSLPIALIGEPDEIPGLSEAIRTSDCTRLRECLNALSRRKAAPTRMRQFYIDQRAREVRVGKERITFSPMEFRLLIFFLRYPGVAFSRRELLRRVSGLKENAKPRIINVLVGRLRKKLELESRNAAHIQTISGVGYAFHMNADVFHDDLTRQSFLSWPMRSRYQNENV